MDWAGLLACPIFIYLLYQRMLVMLVRKIADVGFLDKNTSSCENNCENIWWLK